MSLAPADVVARLTHWPEGTTFGTCDTLRYRATLSRFADGAALKLEAEELGGRDYISLNLYLLASGARLYPCEMPVEKVIGFVRNFTVHEIS